jgi:hypothetical protein
MDVVEKGIISLRNASKHYNIPLTLLSNHLYGKKKSKIVGPISVLIIKVSQPSFERV